MQLPAAYFFVVLIALFHREMRSRTQPATPEPRTHRRGSPAWTPREVATPGRGLRCRQLRTLAALAVANGRCLLTELSYRPSQPWVLIGNGEQSGLHRSPGYIVNQEQSPKSCGLSDPNVPLAGSPAPRLVLPVLEVVALLVDFRVILGSAGSPIRLCPTPPLRQNFVMVILASGIPSLIEHIHASFQHPASASLHIHAASACPYTRS